MATMHELRNQGQSVWLDYIRRRMIQNGELQQLVNDGLRGLTSNPKIFMKAMTEGDEYDDQIQKLLSDDHDLEVGKLYEALAITDIQSAADILHPVYEESEGHDGFVSLEVSPHLAYETKDTIEEARRLWKAVKRENLMIKVPATREGIPAIRQLLSEGLNINITLMFSLDHYNAVSNAYLDGMRQAKSPERTASVASFFVSRITRAVDKALDRVGGGKSAVLKGKIAIAVAKIVYERYRDVFSGKEFEDLKKRGTKVQRVLWGSTSTKNPDYSDVLYMEELIGPETVNTVPPKTLEAFRDHGEVRGNTLMEGVDEAKAQLEALSDLGIDLNEITEQLQRDGVQKFIDPFDELMESLDRKRADLLAAKPG